MVIFFIAAAIGTKRFAEWKVQVEADAVHRILIGKTPDKILFPLFHIHPVVPERNGGIARIPWYRLVIFPDEQGIDNFTFHKAKLSAFAGLQDDLG